MRKALKNNLLEIFKTIYEAHEIVKGFIEKKEYENAQNLLADCQDTAIQIGNIIEESEGEGFVTVSFLEEYCEALYEVSINLSESNGYKVQKQLDKKVIKAENSVRNDIEEKIHIAFFPYKASMWGSFESIWKAAKSCGKCEVSVVAIPYCEYDEKMKAKKWIYEADAFPADVEIIPYQNYKLETQNPDISFIHNPYDNQNSLTSVYPYFYSENIKRHSGCLVYSPYFTLGTYRPENTMFFINSGSKNADKIIVQSKFVADLYLKHGYNKEKLIVLGSPKVDLIVNSCGKEVVNKRNEYMPDEWKSKLADKDKIFLLNTHWSYFLNGHIYKEKNNTFDFAQRYHNDLLNAINTFEGKVGLIWRPHPLLISAIEQRCPMLLEYINDFTKRLEESDYAVIDRNGSYVNAFNCSDAMITTYSSIINEYLLTEKPVHIFQSKPSDEVGENSPIDYRKCYFYFKKDNGMSFQRFIQMVINNEDPMYEERMRMLTEKAFANTDGTAGEKILQHLIDN